MVEKSYQLSEEDEERQFWLAVSSVSMKAIWDNEEDGVYEVLLGRGEFLDPEHSHPPNEH